MTLTRRQQIEALEKDWATNPRWKNVKRTYTAEEVVEVEYQGDPLEIGFNVSYLIDVLNTVHGEKVKITLSGPDARGLIEDNEDDSSLYVVMPMRL